MKKQVIIFSTIFILLLSYIGWIFYMSEPIYIDNPQKVIEKYDIISVRPYGNIENNLDICMVIQIDTTTFKHNHYAVVKNLKWRDTFKDILINTKTPNYKIIGIGTFYHKVNYSIGFNIMMFTTLIIIIIDIIILIVLVGLIRDILDY